MTSLTHPTGVRLRDPGPLDELRAVLPGQVATSLDDDWERSRLGWVLSVDQRPAAVVTVADAEDVVAVVRWARRHGRPVSVQPVGHGATRALDDTVLLRTGPLQQITVDAEARTVRVGAGVKWGALLTALEPTGLLALAGSSPDPSVLGFTLGGGLSWFSRSFGLAAHSARAFDVVDADGELRRITATSDPDLFWALRGGGGGVGVVTAVELGLFDAPPVLGGRMMWPIEMARPVLRAFQAVTRTAPETLSTWAHLFRFPETPDVPEPLRGGAFVTVDMTFLGLDVDADRLLAPLRSLPACVTDTFGPVPLSQLGGIAAEPVDPMPVRETSALLRDLDVATLDRLVDVAGAGSFPLPVVQIRHLGGALRRATDDDGPAGAIDEEYQLFALGVPTGPEVDDTITAAFGALQDAVAGQSTGRRLFNFLGDGADPAPAFTAAALGRLAAVKRTADPGGIFRSHRPVRA